MKYAIRFISSVSHWLLIGTLVFGTRLTSLEMMSRNRKLVERDSRGGDMEQVKYVVENGVRSVVPYIHKFTTYAKGRWLGNRVIDVLKKEFGGQTAEYWETAIECGYVRINGNCIDDDYKFKNGDALLHCTHRHEPPIVGDVTFVGQTDELFAVSKPPSLPMHPCGAYRMNSLSSILEKEPLIPDQPRLLLVHRLDRVTSGLVVLAKSREVASRVSAEIRDKTTRKTYLARVQGRFPARLDHLKDLKRIPGDSDSDLREVSLAALIDALSGADDVEAEEADDTRAVEDVEGKRTAGNKRRRSEQSSSSSSAAIPSVAPIAISLEEAGRLEGAGYFYEQEDGYGEYLVVSCPLGALSYRDGVHGWQSPQSTGKPSLSCFRSLAYDEISDTSLVECRPVTGRTHQLRLHLQLVGSPIANDPCYGGTLFFGQPARRLAAATLLAEMQRLGQLPLSRVPHIQVTETEAAALAAATSSVVSVDTQTDLLSSGAGHEIADAPNPLRVLRAQQEQQRNADDDERMRTTSASDADAAGAVAVVVAAGKPELRKRDGESDDEHLIRTCRQCQDRSGPELERLLHCDGIWLHALRYEGSGWSFQAPYPTWAQETDHKPQQS